MEIVTIAAPGAIQHCPHCLYEQKEGEEIPSAFYGEYNNILIGDCLHHGPFEIEPFPELETQEEVMTRNFHNIVIGANLGQTLMVRRKIEGKQHQYMIGVRMPDGSICVVATMLPHLDNEFLNPN